MRKKNTEEVRVQAAAGETGAVSEPEQGALFGLPEAAQQGPRPALLGRKKALFESVPEVAWVKDGEGRFIAASAMFAEACGVPQSRLIGRTDWDIWPDELAERYAAHEKKAAGTGAAARTHFSTYGPDGGLRRVEIVTAPITGGGGQVIGTLGIARDVSRYRAAASRMRRVSRQVIRAREEEKKKISNLLHDEIGSLIMRLNAALFLAGEELGGKTAGGAAAKLAEAKGTLAELAGSVRRICFDIRPPALGVLGLAGAVQELVRRMSACTSARIECDARPAEGRRSDGLVDIIVYRAVQESLNNALKHSGAALIKVSLFSAGGRLRFSVSDDGRGFDSEKPAGKGKQTLGLQIMREEAESVSGEIGVHSSPGFGTAVRGDFPLRPGAAGGEDAC